MGRQRTDPDLVRMGTLSATPMRDRGLDEQGRRYWRVRTRGDRRTLWTGWATREQVEVIAAELLRKGIPARRDLQEGVRTVGDLLRRWVAHQEARHQAGQIASKSLENYRRAASHWRSALDDVLVSALSRELVEDTLTKWQASGVSARTCKLAADVLVSVVRWGAPRGHCARVELGRLAAVRVRDDEHVNCAYTPTCAEVARVLAEIPAGRNRDTLELLSLTGARSGEALALHVRDYDREAGTLAISGRDDERGRRGKVRVRRWPVLGALAVLLDRLTKDRPPEARLIEGAPKRATTITLGVLEKACEAAGVPRFTSHGLRRFVATELLEYADPRRVAELTGHSVAMLLRCYVRPRAEDLREVVARSGIGQAPRKRGKVIPLGARAQKSGTDDEEWPAMGLRSQEE